MLAYVPVSFDLYRPIAPRLRWTMMNLVGFADRAGRCWPSVRTLSQVVGIGKSSVSRHLAALVIAGAITRTRKPGGVYVYQIDPRFLPAGAKVSHAPAPAPSEVSQHPAPAVPPRATEEKQIKKRSESPVVQTDDAELARWQARLRSWRQSHFWLPFWGPRPNQAGCWAPAAVLSA